MAYHSIWSENGLEFNESEGLCFTPSNVLRRIYIVNRSKTNFDNLTGSYLLSKSIHVFRISNLMFIYQKAYFID